MNDSSGRDKNRTVSHDRSPSRWSLDPTSQRLLLELLRHGPQPRSVLASRLSLSSASLTRLTKPLVEAGLLTEGQPVGTTTAGRPSVPLDIVAETATFIGVKIMRGRLYAVHTTLKGDVVDAVDIDGDWSDPQRVVDEIHQLAATWSDHLAGIGICLGAAVDRDGQVVGSFGLGWERLDLARLVTDATGLPTRVENDVNAFTLAEHWFGYGRNCTDFVVITLGSGIGMGFIANDELVSGANGASGMVGLMRLDDGRLIADVAQTDVVLRRLSAALGRDVAEDEISRLAESPEATVVLNDVARSVGQIVGQCRLVTDPDRVLVAGEGASWLEGREPLIQAGADEYLIWDQPRLPIDLAVIGFHEWARGAAAIAIREHMTA